MTGSTTAALAALSAFALAGCPSSSDPAGDGAVDGDLGDTLFDDALPPDGSPDAEADGPSDGPAAEADGGGSPCETCPAAHATIVEGLSLVRFELSMSRVDADRASFVPLVWTSYAAIGGDKLGLAGTLPAPGWLSTPDAGRLVVWAGHEGAWTESADGTADNDVFRERLLQWLLDDGSRVGFTAGHGEWLSRDGFSPVLTGRLETRGATLAAIPGRLDEGTLEAHDLVIVGNPWGELTAGELDALEGWVRAGGGLLVTGLGWSWPMYNDDPSGDRYPVNGIGERFGFRAMDGSIYDPETPSGTPGMPAYVIRSLEQYQPYEVVVLRDAETDVAEVKTLAAATPDAAYVIEGLHMGLQMPSRDWALFDDPAAALGALDRLYEAELDLAGGVNPPYGGDVVWIISVDSPDAPWWMYAGNPIVYQAAATRREIIPRLNAEGHPGWGVAHEQGHNMHGRSCANLYVAEGTGEVWENVFGVYSYLENGWDWTAQMGAGLFDAGHAYHAQADPVFADLVADPFILLGCLELIWSRYGWDGMRAFMTRAATDAAAGATAGDDAARVAYFVEGLSAGYGVDLAPLAAHWGFAVSDSSRAITSAHPPCDIVW